MIDALDVILLAGTFVAVVAVPGVLVWWWRREAQREHRLTQYRAHSRMAGMISSG